MENNLPKGWIEVKLEEVAANTPYPIGDGDHGQIKPSMYQSSGVPYIRVSDMGWGEYKPENIVYISKEIHSKNLKSELLPGDVLIAKTGATIGKCCIVPDDVPIGNTTSSVGKVTLDQRLMKSKWLLNFFLTKEFKEFMWSISERTAQPGFNNRDIKEFKVPLPPYNEQLRILEKLDALMVRIINCKIRLEKIPTLLRNFRQSVLAAAVSGELTKEWRKDIDEIEMLPLGDLIDDLKYGTSQKSEYKKEGVPVLRIPNIIEDGKISNENLKYSSLPKKEYEKLKLQEGDILLIRSNGSVALVGKTAIVKKEQVGFAYAGYLIRIRCNQKKLLPVFLNHVMASHYIRAQIEIEARSTSGVNNINSEEVKALLIPVPSVEEQKEIVRKIEELFHFADSIEARYQKAKAWFDKIPQAILAKAFRGELAPQNENDEPASELLKRIQQAKQTNHKPSSKAKKRKVYEDNDQLSLAAEE